MYSTRRRFKANSEKGLAGVEFAVVLPVFMLAFFVVLGLAVWGYSVLFAATGVPVEARAFGMGNGPTGILNALDTTGAASGSLELGGAPACERGVYARLDAAPLFNIPMLGDVAMRMRAGSATRNWQFWPGEPTDGCE
jgi:hypothetical protein